MLRRLVSLATIAFSLSLNVPALAAFEQPSDLFKAVEIQKSPMNFTYNLKGRYLQYQMQGMFTGQSQTTGAPIDGKSQMTGWFTVTGPNVKFTMNMQVRFVNRIAYVRLDKVEGTYSDEIAKVAGSFIGKKWFAIPLDESMFAGAMDDQYALLDEIFTVETRKNGAKTTSILSIKRELAKMGLSAVRGLDDGDKLQEMLQKKMALKEWPSFKVVIQAVSNDKNWVESVQMTLGVKHPLAFLDVDGKAMVRSTPVTVEVPKDVVRLDELPGWTGLMGPDVMMPSMPVSNEEEWEMEIPVMPQESPVMAPVPTPVRVTPIRPPSKSVMEQCAEDLSLLRKGYCGKTYLRIRRGQY